MRGVRCLALAAALACVTAGAARAQGLAPPRVITPRGGNVDEPAVAVAPNGRAAVLWHRVVEHRHGVDVFEMAAVGDAPDRLRPARVVPGAAEADGVETATARDGTIVACFGGRPPGAQPAIDCRTAPPGPGLGAPQGVARGHAGLNDVTVRSD